jgi:hypothetical protein
MIVSAWGLEGSGKSTFGLSFPKPLFHLDLDLGGFDRAVWRLEQEAETTGTPLRIYRCDPHEDISKLNWSDFDIITKPYPVPVQIDKLMGVQQQAGVSVRFPRKVMGVKELWQETVVDIVTACQSPAVKTVMPDSATQHWWICHTSLLQEKQEVQLAGGMKESDSKFREKLQPVEFPNDRMTTIVYTCRSFGKNLIMTHYPKDIYKEKLQGDAVVSYKSGEVEPDGFKHTVKLDDIVIWCYTELDKRREIIKGVENPDYNKPVPRTKISLKCGLSGMGMKAVGLDLPAPSYGGLIELQSMMRGTD